MVMEAIFTILLLANDSFRTCLGHEAVFSVTAGDWVLEKNFNKRSTRDTYIARCCFQTLGGVTFRPRAYGTGRTSNV
ncbi:hypothetical protein B0H14DRAFT_2773237 [Mycena olivaceomarginata]|nr:hypothetical protein B0H14DRAFT_2773237 [Mycena olivaceomarginata]